MRFVNVLSKRSEPLPEIPWVMGDPNASYKWQVSVAGGKKKTRGKRSKPKKLENVVIRISLNGKKKSIKLNFLKEGIEEDFNTIEITSFILRALHFTKLKNIGTISADSEMLYTKEKRSFSEVIKILKDFEFEGEIYQHIVLEAVLKPDNTTKVKIDRIHKKGKFPITIGISGKIQKESVDKLVGYLKKHLPIDKILF
jgi:hypothetical protein